MVDVEAACEVLSPMVPFSDLSVEDQSAIRADVVSILAAALGSAYLLNSGEPACELVEAKEKL
jgi:hypothetical protein